MDIVSSPEMDRENLRQPVSRERRVKNLSREVKNRDSRKNVRNVKKFINLKRQSFANIELPSPPPDPNIEIYANRVLSYENSASKAASNVLRVEDAFDNLDKLHTMMEEIVEIRERNAKLFRRVRDLERVKVTRKAHIEAEKLITIGQDIILPDEDVGFAESLLGAMLSSSFEFSSGSSNVRNVGTGRISRNRSIIMENRRVSCPVTIDTRTRAYNRMGSRGLEIKKKRPSLAIGTPKVSKWKRVKAAFKWERAACTSNDVIIIEPEIGLRYLKIPENPGGSSEISGPTTPAGTISSSSSIDDVFHRPQRPSSNQSTRITRRDESSDPSRRSRSLDGDASVPMNFVYGPRTRSKDNSCLQGKSIDPRIHKTPWGKVKDMMQLRRESIGRLPARSISRNDDAHSTSSLDSSDIHRSEQQVDGRPPRVRINGEETRAIITTNITKSVANVDLASRRLTPTLTITVPSSEELRNISSAESITPSPPSPRQSLESGKFERYSTATGYETPRETRTGQVSPASSSSGILRYGLGRSKTCQGVPFAGDYKRQQSLKGESLGSSPKMQRRDSKWNKVKRAFLTSATSVPTSPSRISSYFFDDGDATGGSYSASASAEDLDNESATSPGVQAEIQRNYRLLHDKLGTEFYRKLAEWERLKSNNSSLLRDSTRTSAAARERDGENLRILGEERLTPEFKKKLEEWKRMNKGTSGETRGRNTSESRSVNRRRITDWQLWRSPSKPENKVESPRLSEDFRKKMEEWKRIKSGGTSRREAEADTDTQQREQTQEGEENNGVNEDEDDDDEEEEEEEEDDGEVEEERENVSGNRLSEKRRREWKSLEDEEFRSLERVLEAMEMDRQTRLSKLQRIVGSQPQRTQEVLIHTSTGLYRFEGISRQFTRKLYEWEKSQGISPELSTFRLLDPLRYGVGYPRNRAIAVDVTDDEAPRKSRNRSKSVGCANINSWRTKRDHEKTMIRRPCSLSLNDIDNIDARSCIISSSIPTIPDEEDTSEDIAMEDSEAEPEAVIIDIEDVIEETASPMRKYQPHQTPVYSVAGSETTSIAVPLGTVTARHEPSPVILIEPGEINPLRVRASSSINDIIENETFYSRVNNAEKIVNVALPSSSSTDDQKLPERSIAKGHESKREQILDARDDKELSTEGQVKMDRSQRIICTDDGEGPGATKDSNENWRMAPLTRVESDPRNLPLREIPSNNADESFEDSVVTVPGNFRHPKKLLKTRRLTDTQVGYDWQTMNRPKTCNNVINNETDNDVTDENSLSEINDEFENNPNIERIIINEDTINKIVVPTASSSRSLSSTMKNNVDKDSGQIIEDSLRKEKREATSVFVKTKRIVFSPFRRETKNRVMENSRMTGSFDDSNETTYSVEKMNKSAVPDSNESLMFPITISRESNSPNEMAACPEARCNVHELKRQNLPESPILARKDYRISTSREKSPSIRMMIRRYNEKLENDSCDRNASSFSAPVVATSSATSSCSGSSSPSWRTPLAERKSQNRPDRYDEAKKALTTRRSGVNECCSESCQHPSSALLSKSWSVDFARQRMGLVTRRERTAEPDFRAIGESMIRTDKEEFSPGMRENFASASSVRAMKIRRAKEDFLSMGKSEVSREEEVEENERKNDEPIQQPGGSRDRHEETGDRTNDERGFSIARKDIVKSASVGMINIDQGTYERLPVAGEEEDNDDENEEDEEEEEEKEAACSSLPGFNEQQLCRTEMRKETTGRLARIANKFKRARLRRSKERENSGMRTVLKLCRQSLLVDIANDDTNDKSDTENSNGRAGTREKTRRGKG